MLCARPCCPIRKAFRNRYLTLADIIMKRIIRKRRVTAKEAKENAKVRRQVKAELPELIARHQRKA